MQQDNIEYLSGEVKEILASPPSWVATTGTFVLVGAVVLMGLVGFFFRYPEIVSGEVVISTKTPPVTVYAPKSEYIAELKVADNSIIEAGELLAVFPSNVAYKDVLQLETEIENIGQLDLEKLRSYRPNKELNIGELSQAYSNFVTAFELVPLNASGEVDYATVSAVESVNAQYQRQLRSLEASLPSLKNELTALESELKIARDNYASSVDTTDAPAIFKVNTKIKGKQAEVRKVIAEMERIKIEISKSNVRKLQAQTQANQGAGDAVFQLNQKLDELKKAIKSWKESYLVVAPSGGKIQFYTDLKAKDYVNEGDVLFNVLPVTDEEIYVGKVSLQLAKSSKVDSGQVVNIKFERYDFREHGTVKAKVSKVYPVVKEKAFYAEIVLDKGLVTNLNRKLVFYQNMVGKAEIVTEDKSFIGKLFEKLIGD